MKMSTKGRTAREKSVAGARSNRPRLPREAEAGRLLEPLHGRPRRFSEALRHFTTSVDLRALAIDPDSVFDGRDRAR